MGYVISRFGPNIVKASLPHGGNRAECNVKVTPSVRQANWPHVQHGNPDYVHVEEVRPTVQSALCCTQGAPLYVKQNLRNVQHGNPDHLHVQEIRPTVQSALCCTLCTSGEQDPYISTGLLPAPP